MTCSADAAALALPAGPWLVRGAAVVSAVAVAPTASPFVSGLALPSSCPHGVNEGANRASKLGGVAVAFEIGSLAVVEGKKTPSFDVTVWGKKDEAIFSVVCSTWSIS